ncbi:MAG: nucleotidyltransferase domain-containing protein [Actinobacteria bacterium]|nr:nucleotidyltransferase domain-containing protein [Actinomycetota bacterium]
MDIKTKNIIEKITFVLVKKYEPDKIILLGSYANESFKKDSDIDLLVIKDTEKKNRIDRFVEVKKIIYNPKLKIPVSPIVLTKDELQKRLDIGDGFIKEIVGKGKVLYEK